MKYANIREGELINKIAQDYFASYDCTRQIGNIDFCVTVRTTNRKEVELFEVESLLWAEAKKGKSHIYESLVQLILTIGKARTFDKFLPPAFLGAFDGVEIAFIPYNDIHGIFYINDFNWNVTPSNHETKEFDFVLKKVKQIIEDKSLLFKYDSDEKEIKSFIKNNFVAGKSETSKIRIDKNNFMVIYNKWLSVVKPTIAVNWDVAKESGIIDGDFYLADLLSRDNESLKEKLFVLLKKDHYELDRKIDKMGMFHSSTTAFNDGQKAHNQFWNKYERPPKESYWDYIVKRRDLLVPQDVRERKGSFYTPQIWVELSQKYLTDVLGEDWQDEYYIWDCAAGTGNLLAGLTNKYNIWASTLDTQDVEVMKDRIKNGANLLEDHVFQFDFLNDEFSKLPKPLQDIINDSEKRKKLVVYINPPYAETAKNETRNKDRINKRGVSFTKVQKKYSDKIGIATKELFAQFLIRVTYEIPDSILAQFSKLKIIQGPNFKKFRDCFRSEFLKGFVVPANTFDNVRGSFPIGFMIWKLNNQKQINYITCEVVDRFGNNINQKSFYAYDNNVFLTDWYKQYHSRKITEQNIGAIGLYGSDFQHNNFIRITNCEVHPNRWTFILRENLIETSIYLVVRHCIDATWLNDRDQFLCPNDGWKTDIEFHNDCLTFAIFNNYIQSKYGTNHWIPFTEYEVGSREKFDSNFMTQFINGKLKESIVSEAMIFYGDSQSGTGIRSEPLKFSTEATAVFNAGRELWKYYHAQPNCNVNASLYDIREHFQGRNDKGKMNNKSDDERYMVLISGLRSQLKILAKKIEPKVYEYGFLKI